MEIILENISDNFTFDRWMEINYLNFSDPMFMMPIITYNCESFFL